LKANIKDPYFRKLLQQFILFVLLIAITIILACPNCYQVPLKQGIKNTLFSIVMFVALSQGNSLLHKLLNNYYSWLKNPGKRFLGSIIGTLVISLIIIIAIDSVYLLIQGYSIIDLSEQGWKSMVVGPIIITFIISLFMHSRSFLLEWRQTAIDAEKLKGENITSQYETLKNQVNPHFLFNSLNTLTSLVHVNPDLSVKFIKQLSEVYRYVLDSQNKEVVDLATEIKFVQAYVFLQQIRFGEDLKVTINIPENSTIQIPPLSLQMLLENAVKHNIIVEEAPLFIDIYMEDRQYIVVKNNLQFKNSGVESSGLGLKNIKARYEYLTHQPVHITQTETEFMVKLPVLQLQQA
jgi:sensor histidine kinase YesM